MKFQFQLNFKRTFRVQAHPGQPDDWWPLNKFVATCKTTFIADAKIGPLECRQKPLKLIASNADELYQIVLHYFQRGQFDANISNRFAKKSMVAKLIWWWQATHLRKWKIVSAAHMVMKQEGQKTLTYCGLCRSRNEECRSRICLHELWNSSWWRRVFCSVDGRSMWFTTSTISDWWMGDNKGQLLRHGSVVVERLFLFDVK